MGWSENLLFIALIVAAAFHGIEGDAMVSGTVFCDQCKDGRVTLFDYPLNGMKVSVSCPGVDGKSTEVGETTTNFMGGYTMRFQGAPDLSNCLAQVLSSGQGCGVLSGSPQAVRLMFRMFDMAMYSVYPLVSQPAEPVSLCPRSATNPPPVTPVTPPPFTSVPTPAIPTPTVRQPPRTTPPPIRMPPLPPLPPMPPIPYLQASACPSRNWAMPENRCYWRVLRPDLKVALVFGPIAARRYGTDITLSSSMRGRGDPYRTLLRESTTALLNSYHSIQFPYRPLSVVIHTNLALMGSTRNVLMTALRFMRANSGYGNTTCNFTPCN